jgi:hypothetical protein
MRIHLIVLPLLAALLLAYGITEPSSANDFQGLMNTVAAGWNEGNARKAADCFASDAVYIEPPDRQVYKAREAPFEFFGGTHGFEKPMHMVWHHLAFDPRSQVGFGECTFSLSKRYHEIVIVRLAGGKTQSWRECQYKSDLDWEAFTKRSEF